MSVLCWQGSRAGRELSIASRQACAYEQNGGIRFEGMCARGARAASLAYRLGLQEPAGGVCNSRLALLHDIMRPEGAQVGSAAKK